MIIVIYRRGTTCCAPTLINTNMVLMAMVNGQGLFTKTMNSPKILIVFNPKAGKKYPANYQAVFLRQLKKYSPQASFIWLTTTPNFPQELEQINFNGFIKIIIIGGDGTIKKTAEFILKNNLLLHLAIIPQGSANVLANSLNIPLRESLAIKLASIGQAKAIDVGLVNNEHYFLVGLSVGAISGAVLQAKREIKNRWGVLAYLLALLKQPKLKTKQFNFLIDEKNFKVTGNTLLITNTFSLLKIKPGHWSDYTDGLLEIMVTQNKTLLGFGPIFLRTWFTSTAVPKLFLKTGTTVIVSEYSLIDEVIQLDGEELRVKKIEATILPQRLKVISS